MDNVCQIGGMVEKNGKCVEPKDWIIHNHTFIFGGGHVFQPKCNKTWEGILKEDDVVKDVNKFVSGGECFGTFVGKVTPNVCTKELKDGIAFVDTSDGKFKVGFGSGALLGGLDKEIEFHPVEHDVCLTAKRLDEERKKLDSWDIGRTIPDSINITPSEKEELGKRDMIIRKDRKISDALGKCVNLKKTSPTSISCKIKKKCDTSAFDKTDNVNELIESGLTDENTLKGELNFWKKKKSDIKAVYHNEEVPFVLEMKDGSQIVIAPQIKGENTVEDRIRWDCQKKADVINDQIRELKEQKEDSLLSAITRDDKEAVRGLDEKVKRGETIRLW